MGSHLSAYCYSPDAQCFTDGKEILSVDSGKHRLPVTNHLNQLLLGLPSLLGLTDDGVYEKRALC
jgi:hypothetical protein